MNKDGTIIIIEDDTDDQFIFKEIIKVLNYKNPVRFFPDGEKALTFLEMTDDIPFLILSDLDLAQKLSGLELRRRIQVNSRLSIRCVPYLLFTSVYTQKNLIDVYAQTVQGFFKKPSDFSELKNTLQVIIEYWKKCEAPAHCNA